MSNSTKATRIAGGIAALIASVFIIIVSNMLIAKFQPDYGANDTNNALVILSYFMIVFAVLSKLCSIFLIGAMYRKPMAWGLILTQLVLIALEIATVVLWMGMGYVIGTLDVIFMVFSVIAILLAVIYLFKSMRETV